MIMEFSVGRASQKSAARSFDVLEPPGTKWHFIRYLAIAGNYLLMMFYTTVCGWMLIYFWKMVTGDFVGQTAEQVGNVFGEMLGQPLLMTGAMVLVVLIGFSICSMGLQKGVERFTKILMLCLLVVILLLVGRSVTLEGAGEGLGFYLIPNIESMQKIGIFTVINAAMGQAFFTLSLGIGAMAIFGSYIGKERSLTGECVSITLLDTMVALLSGLIIFPACSAFNVDMESGPKLVFVTLPNVFNMMPFGRLWGSLFFVFMFFAALSTIIAVFENIVSFGIDLWGWSRKKAVLINLVLILVLSLPCVLGFNLWSGFQPIGAGSTIQDLEDFIISNNLLPLGSLFYLLFCTSKRGWGWKKFTDEANTGRGMRFPNWIRGYVSWVLPLIILFIFVQGYIEKFFLNKI